MPTRTYAHPLFGPVTFKTKHDTWVFGDEITFLSGFDPGEVSPLTIPQLQNIPGTHGGIMKFHRRAHAQVLSVFADIERFGALKHIKTCAGSFYMRLKKPTSGNLSKDPSNHAFGIAIDLNADDGSLGASVSPVAPFFQAVGFRWGISFNDPMHFEVTTFVDHPEPIATPIKVVRAGAALSLDGQNLAGHPVVSAAKAEKEFKFKRLSATSSTIRFKGKSSERTLKFTRLGDYDFVLLTEVASLAGLGFVWDNASKTATLTDI